MTNNFLRFAEIQKWVSSCKTPEQRENLYKVIDNEINNAKKQYDYRVVEEYESALIGLITKENED